MPAERIGWRALLRRFRAAFGRTHAVRFVERGLFEGGRAHQRSLQLLLSCLTPAQRAEYQRLRAFTVQGASGRRYRITYGTTANIEVLAPAGWVDHRLCAGPEGLPAPAVMLAQKLMLESREAEFLRIAARHSAVAGSYAGAEPISTATWSPPRP